MLRSFEVTGESCVPAIVTDDVYSIFEEQEIVPSLADSIGGRDKNKGDGGGRLEKMAVGKVVYAEAEKMLAFGPVSCAQAQGATLSLNLICWIHILLLLNRSRCS